MAMMPAAASLPFDPWLPESGVFYCLGYLGTPQDPCEDNRTKRDRVIVSVSLFTNTFIDLEGLNFEKFFLFL